MQPEPVRLSFTGRVWPYSQIVYVNLLLSVATFGVYTGWAKVRSRRYLYGSVRLLGHHFDFDAQPLAILIARVLVVAFIAASVAAEWYADLQLENYGFAFLLFIMLTPILLVRGRSFNARHTLYRGVRLQYALRFSPSYAYLVVTTIPLLCLLAILPFLGQDILEFTADVLAFHPNYSRPLAIIALALFSYLVMLFPVAHWWRHRIRVGQLSFGKVPLRYVARLRGYVLAYVVHLVFFLATVYLTVGLAFFSPTTIASAYGALLVVLFVLLSLILIVCSYFCRVARIFWSSIEIDGCGRFDARFTRQEYLKIVVRNLWLLVLSLGLLLPWCRIRKWRFLTSSIVFVPTADIEHLLASDGSFETAMGSEAMDIQGLDLDLGII